MSLVYRDLGLIGYDEAYSLQRELVERRARGEIEDTLLLLEHLPVFTLGRNGAREHILADDSVLRREGIAVREADRGGDVTYHGPGQIVGYPIISLKDRRLGVKGYIRRLEEILISVCRDYGVDAGRIPGLTGVWVGEEKIAAIGIGARKWITYHGFALNVDPYLEHFKLIVPCGIRDKGVTSLAELLGRDVNIDEVKSKIEDSFLSEFGKRG
ncbi:MAG: lipoyl(octanoyl) transferase LipB [bacterium]